MKVAFVFLILCLVATAVNAASCPEDPCTDGKYCVSVLGARFCSHPAKKGHACSAEPGKRGVYDLVPPCDSGLTCDTSKTIHTCT